MMNLNMKFQNCILRYSMCDKWTDTYTDGQPRINMPPQLLQSLGHKNTGYTDCFEQPGPMLGHTSCHYLDS